MEMHSLSRRIDAPRAFLSLVFISIEQSQLFLSCLSYFCYHFMWFLHPRSKLHRALIECMDAPRRYCFSSSKLETRTLWGAHIQALDGWFSAESYRILVVQASLESFHRDLQNAHSSKTSFKNISNLKMSVKVIVKHSWKCSQNLCKSFPRALFA